MEEWSKIGIAAYGAFDKTDIRVDDNPSLSVAEMNAKCRRVDNLGLVVIDYLQLMVSARRPQLQRRKPPAGRFGHLPLR